MSACGAVVAPIVNEPWTRAGQPGKTGWGWGWYSRCLRIAFMRLSSRALPPAAQIFTAILAAVVTLWPTSSRASEGWTTDTASPRPVQQDAMSAIERRYIAACGRGDERLSEVAQAPLIDSKTLAHDAGDGLAQSRLAGAGFNVLHGAENVAFAPDLAAAQDSLEESPSHFDAMMGAFDFVGSAWRSMNRGASI
jgi:hypothetical protein